MNQIEDIIRKAQNEALNKLRLIVVSGSHYPMLLMASYCGGENPKCTDELPCEECLKMSNIVLIPKDQVKLENIISGYDFLNDCRQQIIDATRSGDITIDDAGHEFKEILGNVLSDNDKCKTK